MRREKPNLILMDLVLPGIDGRKVCSILKKDPNTSEILIIMVTAKKRMEDIVAGLKDYADDYVTKPFEPQVLLARIQALLRRRAQSAGDQNTTLEIDGLVINRGAYEVLASGRPIALTKTEFEILALLAGKPNQVFSRSRILDNVREDGYPITERVVDYHLTGLRKKLGKAKKIYPDRSRGRLQVQRGGRSLVLFFERSQGRIRGGCRPPGFSLSFALCPWRSSSPTSTAG